MKIVLNLVPPTINKYIGRNAIWQYQADKKKVHEAVRMSTIGINPKYKKCEITIIYYFKDKRRHDPRQLRKDVIRWIS